MFSSTKRSSSRDILGTLRNVFGIKTKNNYASPVSRDSANMSFRKRVQDTMSSLKSRGSMRWKMRSSLFRQSQDQQRYNPFQPSVTQPESLLSNVSKNDALMEDILLEDHSDSPLLTLKEDNGDAYISLHSMDSNEKYYLRIKEEILARGRGKPSIVKPKRKSKSIKKTVAMSEDIDVLNDFDSCPDSSMASFLDQSKEDAVPKTDEEVFATLQDIVGEYQSSERRNKVAKKSRKNRYNPIGRKKSGNVTLLREASQSSMIMSWCS